MYILETPMKPDLTPTKPRWPQPYEKPKIRVIKPRLDGSVTTTISSSSPPVKRSEAKP
jgi:hypothetical protein